MERYIKVRDNPDYVRDLETGAILNTNEKKILKARERKKQRLQEKEEIQKMKSDIHEIKSLLTDLVSRMGE